MAKRESDPPASVTEDKIGDFAEDLGKILGTAQSKASAWLDQRKSIADQLTQIRDTANQYLQQLTEGAAAAVTRARRGRPPGSGAGRGPGRPPGSQRKKRTMSAEARAKISAAQRKRWAKQKKEAQ